MNIEAWFTRFIDSALELGEQYGVNPFVFAAIYIGAIPFFTICLGWLLRNMRKRKPIILPAMLTGLFFVSAYLYLIAVGRGVPVWVYLFVGVMVVFGVISTGSKIRKQSIASFDYDWLVIGGGAAGLVGAGIGAAFGAKTILVEKHRLGGDCTWTGCVPSKTLLAQGKNGTESRKALEEVRRVRQLIYEEADSPEKMEAQGMGVFPGEATFTNSRTIELKGNDGETRTVRARKILIATGSAANVPPVEGLDSVPYLTNNTIFELEEAPKSLAVMGGGPIGLEMAQAFERLGSEVTVVEFLDRILPRDQKDLAAILQRSLEAEGIVIRTGDGVTKVEAMDGSRVRLTLSSGATLEADRLLVATGRRPSVEGLGLEKAGIEFSKKGIPVNGACRTNQRHVYAIGDVTGQPAFTHWAEHMAKNAAAAALLGFPLGLDRKNLPWATYTEPEMAHVGATEEELSTSGRKYKTYAFPYDQLDRAITEGKTTGEIRLYATSRGRILGADILGHQAGDMIAQVGIALKKKMKLAEIASVIYAYPSWAMGIRRAADQWYMDKQKPSTVRLLQRVFGLRGSVPTLKGD